MAFISPEDRAYMSPSSSPGGSPSASSFVDSSPPASPSLQPLDLNRPPTPMGITHPFAGSTHATTHPSNELRYSNSSYTPATWAYRSQLSSSADNAKVLESLFDEEEGFSTSSFDPEPPDEAALWEDRITRAVDTGEAEFTWKNSGLTFVPPFIVELNSLGVISQPAPRTFKRVQTAPPAVFSSPHRSLFAQRAVPTLTRSQGLMIFLANNEIGALPPEFFKLSNLTVLSLRNNNLADLPPEIAQLQALKDLDVVNNNLRFLPAEMTTMTLTNLNVHTNPWHPDPAKTSPQDDGPGAVDGSTRVHFRVPPLREMVLRYLLTPSANQRRPPAAPSQPSSTTTSTASVSVSAAARQSTTTMLEDCFQLPLQEGALTPTDAALLARLAPSAVSAPRRHAFSRATTSAPSAGLFSSSSKSERERECAIIRGGGAGGREGGEGAEPATTVMQKQEQGQEQEQKSSGRCPSPRHAQVSGPWPWARLGPPFVLPAEERYTWVGELAGVRVGETTGGVPLLWRGCGRGCLDFLDWGEGAVAPAGAPENGTSGRDGRDDGGDHIMLTDD